MKVKWSAFAMNLPQLIGVGMAIVEGIKGAKGAEKEAAVINGVKQSFGVAENLNPDADNIDEAALDQAIANYITARVALQNLFSKANVVIRENPAIPEGFIVTPNPAIPEGGFNAPQA